MTTFTGDVRLVPRLQRLAQIAGERGDVTIGALFDSAAQEISRLSCSLEQAEHANGLAHQSLLDKTRDLQRLRHLALAVVDVHLTVAGPKDQVETFWSATFALANELELSS
jgi:hypothetical protein